MSWIIQGMCEPDGPGEGWVLCDDDIATRFFVIQEPDCAGSHGVVYGNFETRELAESYVRDDLEKTVANMNANRRDRFTWKDGDLDHG